MTTPDEPRDGLHDDLHDDELSRRYRALSPELPHPDTDAFIRAAAREAVIAPPRRHHNRAIYGGLAMAASVTLMVAILLPSWRSGVLREEVAVQEAAPMVAPAESLAEEPSRPTTQPGLQPDTQRIMEVPAPSADVLHDAVAASAAAPEERRLPTRSSGMQRKAEQAPAPVSAEAETVPESVVSAAPPVMSKPAIVASDSVPALAEADRAAGAGAQESREQVMEEQKAQGVARQELAARQKTRLARAPSAVPPATLQADDVPTLDALLQEGRHAEALVLLQTGTAATDPALASRRDLLRQLLPGQDRTLTCRPDSGPASSRVLCALVGAYQTGRKPTGDEQDALRRALLAEGVNPAPWLLAVSRLP